MEFVIKLKREPRIYQMLRKNRIHDKSFEFEVQTVKTTKIPVQSREFVLSKASSSIWSFHWS